MPHIAITMYPGRGAEAKKALAKKMQDAMAEELQIDKKVISVSVEDIERDKWDDNMSQIAEDDMFINTDI